MGLYLVNEVLCNSSVDTRHLLSFPEAKLRGKMKLEDLKSDYYLAMLLVSWKICY